MRLLIAIAVACFLLMSNSACTQDKSSANDPHRTTQTQNNNPSPTPPTVEINIGTQANTAQSQPTKTETPRETRPEITLGESLIIAVTAVYAIFSIFTYFAVKRQANIADKTADALIAGQRAWVMVDVELLGKGIVTERRGDKEFHGTQIKAKYRNDGQTPAWITECRASLIVIPDDLIPEHPDLSKTEVLSRGTITVATGKYGHRETTSKELQCPANYPPNRKYLIYGVVRYRTAFRGTGETIFGYSVISDGDGVERLELPGWNENT
jgi:hypothetical protein